MNGKTLIVALLGFAGGVFTGYYVCKQKLEEQYQEDTADYRERLLKKMGYESDEEFQAESDEMTELEHGGHIQKSSIETKDTYRKVVTNYQKPDLASLARHSEVEEDPEQDEGNGMTEEEYEEMIAREEEMEAEARSARMANVDREEPYVIDQWQFAEEEEYEHHDKIHLYYYRFDDVICDDNDEQIEDVEDVIGWDFYKTLERQTLAHVRNEKLHTDYEIHALSKSFGEDVTGRLETDKEREFRRVSRYKEAIDEE